MKMRVSQMLRKKQSGFTLIEMMVVIAVFAIVAAIAIPNFMSLLPGMRLNGAARQVMGDLMAARMNAVKLNKDTKVTFKDNDYEYEVWYDENSDGKEDASEITTKNIQTNYHDVTLGSNINPIFYPRGTANGNGTITLTSTNSGNSKSVTVIITGRVKIQ